MSHRERSASAAVSAATPRSVSASATAALPSVPPLAWEEIYRAASPARQRELLALARSQGVLYYGQIAAAANGAIGLEPAARLLAILQSEHAEELEPVRAVPPGTFFDPELDAAQRQAVARALETPDICLIQGWPGTGKSRMLVEVILQAVSRGERIVLVALGSALLDQVLQHVGQQDAVFGVRLLAPGEAVEALPAASRSLTFAERVRFLKEHPIAGARTALAAAESHDAARRHEGDVYTRLEELAAQTRQLNQQIDDLHAQRSGLQCVVEKEAATAANAASGGAAFLAALRALAQQQQAKLAEFEQALAALDQRQVQLDGERAPLVDRLERLRPLVAARELRHWWTATWFRAVLTPGLRGAFTAAEKRLDEIRQAQDRATEEQQANRQEREKFDHKTAAQRAEILRAEVTARQQRCDDAVVALQKELGLVREKWDVACRQLVAESPRPEAPTAEAVAEARTAWQQQRQHDQERCQHANEWLVYLQEASGSVAERLPGFVNLVAATPAALAADEHFGDVGTFDLLIVQEADCLPEAEFLPLARRARRWLLIGEPLHCGLEPPDTAAKSAPDGFFERLWNRLHTDPRVLPRRWAHEHERWCCRLRIVPPEQRRWLESERVADSPDIELRILAIPGHHPALAEVVFPPRMSIGHAKQFLERELEELPIDTRAAHLLWIENEDRLSLRFEDSLEAEHVPLCAGVTEVLAAATPGASERTSCVTSRLDFARAAGWDRTRAEEWVRRHLGLRDLGRTAYLDVPHRMHAELAAFVSDVLLDGGYQLSAGHQTNGTLQAPLCRCLNGTSRSAGVQFVAVPAAETAPERSRGRVVRLPKARPGKGGAGLEINLADARHRERLPADVRSDLPTEGLINYPEAQTIARLLEELAAGAVRDGKLAVAVVALYPAQAELIRCLVRQAPALAASPLEIEIGGPSDFLGREAAVVFVSLTRSHAHRAVAFGDCPEALARALTRCRSKLVLVGDPGTLTRRCQWDGPVDQLDEAASARERTLVARLVEYCQGRGRHPQAFHLCEVQGA